MRRVEENEFFLQIMDNQELEFHPVTRCLLRPLQGIGIVVILGAQFLWILQMATGEAIWPLLQFPAFSTPIFSGKGLGLFSIDLQFRR